MNRRNFLRGTVATISVAALASRLAFTAPELATGGVFTVTGNITAYFDDAGLYEKIVVDIADTQPMGDALHALMTAQGKEIQRRFAIPKELLNV